MYNHMSAFGPPLHGHRQGKKGRAVFLSRRQRHPAASTRTGTSSSASRQLEISLTSASVLVQAAAALRLHPIPAAPQPAAGQQVRADGDSMVGQGPRPVHMRLRR